MSARSRASEMASRTEANRQKREAEAKRKAAEMKLKGLGDDVKRMLNDYKDIVENITSVKPDKMDSTILYMIKLAYEDMEGDEEKKNDFETKVKELLDHLDTYLKNKPNTTKAEGGYKRKQKSRKKAPKKEVPKKEHEKKDANKYKSL